VAVSNHQHRDFPNRSWNTIYNGADLSHIPFSTDATGGYLAFIGRLTANKGVDTAIHVARKAGIPLKIAGNISDEPGGKKFFEQKIRPHLNRDIEWIGEIGNEKKFAFLGRAKALLAPIRWDEPCANVVMESLACGTPVIAAERGSMPELVRDGLNGFIASDEDRMIEAIARINEISRRACREDAETRFSSDEMVEKYLSILINLHAKQNAQLGRLFPRMSQ
jgi:glycosyltransferase involved in cell wall biosynthesis